MITDILRLESLCLESGIDYPTVLYNITESAKTAWLESGMTLTFEIYLDTVISRVSKEAAKDRNVLKLYLDNQIKQP